MKVKRSFEKVRRGLLGYISAFVFIYCCISPYAAATAQVENTSKEALDDELLEQVSLLSEVLARIQQDYLDAPDSKTLMYGAIRGMLRSLDPYSQFFEPESYAEFRSDSRGAYGGLGMEIGVRDDRLTVISPLKDTPADKAGIQSGDIISQIEGESTGQMTTDDAVKLLRGEPGTQVVITIIREGERQPIEVTLTRDVIRFHSVESKTLKGDIGYIRINQFRETTADDVDAAFEAFEQQNIRGIILDLRSNPGGLLRSAVEIASDFLEPKQLIVYTQGKAPREDYFAEEGKQQKRYPLIVLVNEGSASASEIVAAAIKDHGRGLVMGEKTFGKASVQQVFPLEGGAAVKLTIARYYSPNGTDIDKVGIVPDIEEPWFSVSEHQMLNQLRSHEAIKKFIAENGDDVLPDLEKAKLAPRDDRKAATLLRKYQELVNLLAEDQIILSDAGIKLAIARETKNEVDEYVYDPQIIEAVDQLRTMHMIESKLRASSSPGDNSSGERQ